MTSIFNELTPEEYNKVQSCSTLKTFEAGENLFSEGDTADYIYFIESGKVSIFIEKFNSKEELQILGPGSCFGEMAVFNQDIRTASASTLDQTSLNLLPKECFIDLLNSDKAISHKINRLLTTRNEELILKEKLIDITGLRDQNLHIGIKGDPSLRESAMTRERYISVVDNILPDLVPRLEDILLNRCAHQIYLAFNNGEVRVSTILDPFSEEFHPAIRLVDSAYVERHFPKIDFERKGEIIGSMYDAIKNNSYFSELPTHLNAGFTRYFDNWKPLSHEAIANSISQLPKLREIPDFYVRNVTISIIKDAIHMQFNCDGAHIVSSAGYQKFLQDNL